MLMRDWVALLVVVPEDLKNRLATAAREVDLDRLPEISLPPEHGHDR